MNKHYNVGKNNPNFKGNKSKTDKDFRYSHNNHCVCGKLISNNAKNCRECWYKLQQKRLSIPENNPMFGKKRPDVSKRQKDKNNPNYIDGRKSARHYCIENCGREISYSNWLYGSKKCSFCSKKDWAKLIKIFYKGSNNPNFGNHKLAGKNNPHYGKTASHSKYIKYKNIYFHSSWEKKYAKYLDKNKIEWLYESKYFDLGNCTYTPDFYLPKTDEYIEIKGWWRPEAKKKFNLFKKLYPNIKIKVLMRKELKEKGIL
jgi:hypothetical protein